ELESRRQEVLFAQNLLGKVLALGPAAKAAARDSAYAMPAEPIYLADPGTVRIVEASRLVSVGGIDAQPMTLTMAREMVVKLARTDPAMARSVELVGP